MWGITGYHTLLEGDETLVCIRQGRGVAGDITYVDGLPTRTHDAVQFQITATVQPMGGRDLQLMPEAFRAKDMLSLWQAHRTAAQDSIRLDVADVILFRGRAYQVQGAEDWQSYTKATLCGIDVGSFAGIIDPEGLPVLYPTGEVIAPDPVSDPAPTPGPGTTPTPLPEPTQTPTPEPGPTPEPTPSPTPTDEDELMLIGPMLIANIFYNPGDLHDCTVPGDPNNSTFNFVFPRSGKVLGYTLAGQANASSYGAYITQRVAATGVKMDAAYVDPASQPGYNQDAGAVVNLPTPIVCAALDVVQLKIKIKDGNFGQVNFMCFLQVTLDAATSV